MEPLHLDIFKKTIAQANPKATYERLARIQRVYVPTNLINQSYNIKPGSL
jgi:hypothetical protein